MRLHTVLDEGTRLALRHKVCAIPGSACGSLAAGIDDIFWWGCNLPQVVFGGFWHVFWYYFTIFHHPELHTRLPRLHRWPMVAHGGWPDVRCSGRTAAVLCQPAFSPVLCGGRAFEGVEAQRYWHQRVIKKWMKMDENNMQHGTLMKFGLSWEMRGIDWIDMVISCYFSSLLRLVWLSCRRTARPYWRNEQDQLLALLRHFSWMLWRRQKRITQSSFSSIP